MIPIIELKKMSKINDSELFDCISDGEESSNEIYLAYGIFHNNNYYETRYGIVKNNVTEGIIVCWEGNPFQMNEDYDLILKI